MHSKWRGTDFREGGREGTEGYRGRKGVRGRRKWAGGRNNPLTPLLIILRKYISKIPIFPQILRLFGFKIYIS